MIRDKLRLIVQNYWANRKSMHFRQSVLLLITVHAFIVTVLFAVGYAGAQAWMAPGLQFWTLLLVFFVVTGTISVIYVRYVCLPFLGLWRTLRALINKRGNPAAGKANKIAEGQRAGYLNTDGRKEQVEIDALQSQMNPHFLYNTLESLRGQAVIEGLDEIAEMIEALSSFYRYNVSQSSKIVTLADELRIVDNYFLILQYRFGKKFHLVKILEESDDALQYTLPRLTIQPVVENAIFHGLETKIGEGQVTIRATVTEQRLSIHIEDDGVGIEKSKLDALNESFRSGTHSVEQSNSSGIGLFNIDRRIKLNYGEGYGLIVYSTPDVGTDVEITLPLVKE